MIKYLISDLDSILENKDFVNDLRNNLSLGKILYVPSNPKDDKTTKNYGDIIISAFYENDINFLDVEYINESTNMEDIKNQINDYSLIFLMGGVTLLQNKFIENIDLKSVLKGFNGAIMGMSAGALNMCDVTLDSAYFGDSEKTVITRGLGLVDIVVEVHFDINNDMQINEVKNSNLKVHCIPNDSAIMFDDKTMNTYGTIYLCENNKIVKRG